MHLIHSVGDLLDMEVATGKWVTFSAENLITSFPLHQSMMPTCHHQEAENWSMGST